MKVERTKNAVRNIYWGIFEKIISLLLPFITRTVMIKVLGAEYLGLSSLFTSILSVLSISELGIGTAIVFSMYKPIAENDNETLCALLNLYKKIYHTIGTIILVIGILLTPFLQYLIKGNCPSDVNIYILYFIYLINTVISYYLFAYMSAIFSAYQRNDLLSKRTSLIALIGNVLKIIMLLVMRNYYAYAVVIPLITVATNIFNAVLARKMFPKIICKGTVSKEIKQSLKKRIQGLLSFKIYGVIFSSVDTIVISSFLGLTQLAIYNNYYYIQTSIVGFMVIFTNSITAGIGNKMVTNSKEDNYNDLKKFTFANGWITGWCSVAMLCLYQHFVRLWVGEELLFPFSTMCLMVLYFLLPRISTMTYTYREAAGLWWEDRIRPLVSAVVNLFLNLVLVRYIGMNGVIISTLICTILINIPWGTSILFRNYFERSAWEYFGQMIYYIVVIIITGFSTLWLCECLSNYGVTILIIKGIICCIVPNIIFYIFYRHMPEYKNMKSMITKIINTQKEKRNVFKS